MFNKLSLLALVAPLVAGLQLQIPENPTSGGSVTIKWTSAAGDPATFSFELVNEVFHNAFAIANNVVPELGQMTITLPVVPIGGGYTLEAVNIGDVNSVFASTGTFSIADNSAASSTTSSGTSGTSTRTTSGSGAPTTTTQATTRPTTTTSAFGTTVTQPTTTTTGTGTSSTGTGTGTTSSAAGAFTNAASTPLKLNSNVGALAAVVLSAVAGAAALVL